MLTALSLGLTGCFRTTRIVQRTQAPEMYRSAPVEVLEKIIADRDAGIKTLNASVLVTATTGGGKEGKENVYTSVKGYIFVQKPSTLGVLLLLPIVGSTAMNMVSTGDSFKMTIPPLKKAFTGTGTITKPSKNALENLRPVVFFDSLLVPGAAPEDYVTRTESTRILQPTEKHKPAIEEPDYDFTILQPKSGHLLRPTRIVHISRIDMLPFQQDVFNDQGQTVTQTTYQNYKKFGEQMFPTLINIRRPLDELSLRIEVTKLTFNESFSQDQFQLEIPSNYTLQKME